MCRLEQDSRRQGLVFTRHSQLPTSLGACVSHTRLFAGLYARFGDTALAGCRESSRFMIAGVQQILTVSIAARGGAVSAVPPDDWLLSKLLQGWLFLTYLEMIRHV